MSKNEDNTEDKQVKVKGAPKKIVDKEVLKKLCEIQCTIVEMAYVLGVRICLIKQMHR